MTRSEKISLARNFSISGWTSENLIWKSDQSSESDVPVSKEGKETGCIKSVADSEMYSEREKIGFKNQFLHAHTFEFLDLDGRLAYMSNKKFEAPLPKAKLKVLEYISTKKI